MTTLELSLAILFVTAVLNNLKEREMDNRLDFISKFEDGAVEKMTEIRAKFMALDEELKQLSDGITPPGARVFAIARTNIESALHYAIKGLCLKFEKVESV